VRTRGGRGFCLYTSGTTGAPKGVVREIGGYLVALEWSMSDNCDAPVFC
jgi:propionyl-CoA synthetase